MSDFRERRRREGTFRVRRSSPASPVSRRTSRSRTALSAFGLSIAIGAVLPAITDGSDWLLITLGAAFGLLGVLLLAHGHLRHEVVLHAIDRGHDMPPDGPLTTGPDVAGVILGLALVVGLVILELRS